MTESEYNATRARIAAYRNAWERLYPNAGIDKEEQAAVLRAAQLDRAPTNEEESACQVYRFVNEKPDRFTVYLKRTNGRYGIATTWTGDKLGDVVFGRTFTVRGFHGTKHTRCYFAVRGLNACNYRGVWCESVQDGANMKRKEV